MDFYKDLYVSPDLEKKRTRAKWLLKFGIKNLDFYVIALAKGNDMLEIFHSRLLYQKYYREQDFFVVGIAKSYDGAVKLVEKMVQDTFDHQGDYQVKHFIQQTSV